MAGKWPAASEDRQRTTQVKQKHITHTSRWTRAQQRKAEKSGSDRVQKLGKWDNSGQCHNNVGLFNGFSLSLKPDRGGTRREHGQKNGKALKKFITAIAVPKSLFDHLVANAKPKDVLLKTVGAWGRNRDCGQSAFIYHVCNHFSLGFCGSDSQPRTRTLSLPQCLAMPSFSQPSSPISFSLTVAFCRMQFA